MKEEKEPIEECPNCGAIWAVGTEEYDWQECDCCGYPDCDDELEEDYEDACDYFEVDTPEE